jgi:heme-degrading monooxygenase HmoA
MYSSTFIFTKKQFDDEFHRLDQAIADAAKSIPGYLGEEAWENSSTGLISNVYYWDSLESLHILMRHPRHLEAKAAQSKWLDGYQVIISQVLRAYGDAKLQHPIQSVTLSQADLGAIYNEHGVAERPKP